MIIYFDTETTGLVPGRVIQLSYVLDYGDKVEGKNFFFAVDYVPEEASKIHGFTTEKLAILSKGKTFSDYADEIYNDFSVADLIIAHNDKFDINFLAHEFSYIDIEFKFKASLCSMRYFTPILKIQRKSGGYKYPKLSEVAEFFELYPYDVTRKCIELFKTNDVSFHDARYDTTTMYLCMKMQAEKNGEVKTVI